MVLLHIQDINHKSQHIGSSGKGYSCNYIKTDPQSPWDFLFKVCNCTQSFPETDDNKKKAQYHHRDGNNIKRSKKFHPGFKFTCQKLPNGTTIIISCYRIVLSTHLPKD